jgi:hypothetical protein
MTGFEGFELSTLLMVISSACSGSKPVGAITIISFGCQSTAVLRVISVSPGFAV